MKSKSVEYSNKINLDCINNMIAYGCTISVADLNSNLTHVLVDLALEVFPRKRCRKYIKVSNEVSTSCCDGQCWNNRQQYHKAKHRYNTNRTVCNYNMLSKINEYKNNLSRVKLKEKETIVRKFRDTRKSDPRDYWQVLKGHKDHVIQICVASFLEYFRSLAGNEETSQPALSINTNDMTEENIVLDGPISEIDIQKCIATLKNNKSAGIDHVINEYIKSTCDILCPLYVILFNKILDTGVMPEEWLVCCIVPFIRVREM